MKKYLFLILAIIPFVGFSQPGWEKKSMASFNRDTLAYLKHNFRSNDNNMLAHFAGKTIGEVIPELGFNIKYIILSSASGYDNQEIKGITLIFRGEKQKSYTGIDIIFQNSTQNSELHKILRGCDMVSFNQKILSMIKDMKVKLIFFTQVEYTLIDDSSLFRNK